MGLHGLGSDGLRIDWVDGGLFLGHPSGSLLLDAPDGAGRALAADGLFPDVIAFSSGRLAAICGLGGVVAAAVEAGRTRPLRVWAILGEERAARLIEGVSGPGLPFPLVVDIDPPGASFAAGPFEVRTVALRRGEPSGPDVTAIPAVGFRVRGPVDVAYAPGAGPGVRALCDGAELAVVEVGARPWPADAAQWRLSVDDAIAAARGARRLVLVGDDGPIVPSASA